MKSSVKIKYSSQLPKMRKLIINFVEKYIYSLKT